MNFEICPVLVGHSKYITLKIVIKKVQDIPMLMMYLPDNIKACCSKEYLFAIVNTFDPQFFPALVKEVD